MQEKQRRIYAYFSHLHALFQRLSHVLSFFYHSVYVLCNEICILSLSALLVIRNCLQGSIGHLLCFQHFVVPGCIL